jgi:peptide/nickel transport system permease protein
MFDAATKSTVGNEFSRPTKNGRDSAGRIILRMVVRRVILAPVILLGVALAVFVMIDLSHTDPAIAKLGLYADAQTRATFAAQHGLNDPLPVRFWRYLGDLVHFRLGDSLVRPEPVSQLIGDALPITMQLIVGSTVLAVLISAVLGTIAAVNDGRLADRIISNVAAIFQASPPFWVGLLFIELFAVSFRVLPPGGYVPLSSGFQYWFSSLIGPSAVLALPFAAAMTRLFRASMADELNRDYVRTAIGVGIPLPVVLGRNVLRNALITPITVLAVYVGALMSGAILVETVFNLPGMGTLLTQAVSQADLGVVRGVALVGATVFVLVNLMVDVAYVLLNPRGAEANLR